MSVIMIVHRQVATTLDQISNAKHDPPAADGSWSDAKSVVAEFDFADVATATQNCTGVVDSVRRHHQPAGRAAERGGHAKLASTQPQLSRFVVASGHNDVVTCPTTLAVAERSLVDVGWTAVHLTFATFPVAVRGSPRTPRDIH
jgi:hypothetical protein